MTKSDPFYERLEIEWSKAQETKNVTAMSRVLLAIIRYFRQGSNGQLIHTPLVLDRLAHLEALIPEMSTRDFLVAVNTIQFARRHVAETSQHFGAGFAENPTSDELRAIGPAKRPKKTDQGVVRKKAAPGRKRVP